MYKTLLSIILLLFCITNAVGAELGLIAPPQGTVFVTRNAGGEEANPSPGHWNHSAVMGPNGYVIEGQYGRGVIATPYITFYTRYPNIVALKVVDETEGPKVAMAAVAQLGHSYKKILYNCVTVVERAIRAGTNRVVLLRKPDDVYNAGAVLSEKFVRDDLFIPPVNPWAGVTQNKSDVLP